MGKAVRTFGFKVYENKWKKRNISAVTQTLEQRLRQPNWRLPHLIGCVHREKASSLSSSNACCGRLILWPFRLRNIRFLILRIPLLTNPYPSIPIRIRLHTLLLVNLFGSMGGGWSLNSIRDTPSFNSINRKTISNHEYENRTLPPQNWNPPSSTSAAPPMSFNLKTPTFWNC